MSIKSLAKGLRRSERTVRDYIDRGMPRTSLKAAQQWQKENLSTYWQGGDSADGAELTKARVAKTLEETRWKRLQNEQIEENLLDRDAVVRQITEWCVRLKTRIMQIPDRLANIAPGELKAITKTLAEDAIISALREAYHTELCGDEVASLIRSEATKMEEGEWP